MDTDQAATTHDSALALLDSRFAQTVVTLLDGARVAVRTAGPVRSGAPVIVLLHGIGSGAASWLHVALRLSAQARVVAWDAPGYGESTPLASPTPLAIDFAVRLGELLRAMQVASCVLVGHSLGALMATAFAADAGAALVRRLVLISPARGYGAAGRAEQRQKVLDGRLRNLQERGIVGMALESSKRMLSAAAEPAARAWVQWNAGRLNTAGYAQAVQMLCGDDIDRHRPLAMPVEVLVGDADVVTLPDDCREVALAFDASFTLIPQAGHASPVEQPLVVASRLARAADISLETDNMTETANDGGIEEGADKYIVPALERGLKLLGEFSRDNRRLGPPELARRLGLPRSTIFRLLATLESMGFIERADGGSDYQLGMAVLRLGFEYLASLELTQLGQPVIERLCDEIRYPCNIVVRDGRSIVYVAKVTPPTPLSSSVRVGTRLPAHATVLGRILLEDLKLTDLRRLYPEERLEAFSASTPKTVIELFDMVEIDRQRGYVLGEGFFEASISTIAAPVRDHTSRIVAALGATIPSAHVAGDRLDELVQCVRTAADELSQLLNYSPRSGDAQNVVSLPTR